MFVVTGANGFIGSALVWQLNQLGRRDIICVDSTTLADRPQLLNKLHYKEFLSTTELWPFLDTPEAISSVDAILHMGACSSTTEMDVLFLRENNFEYTKRLWQWCTTHAKRFIYASSGAVYGNGAEGFDDALPSSTFKPLNPYGESKASFDRWVETQTRTPPAWFGLRFFNVFGPNEYHKGPMSSVVFKAFSEISAGGSMTLFRSHEAKYEDGMQMRDFIYVKDITRWCVELLQVSGKSGIYNMGFGTARTWLDLASAVFSSLDAPMKINWVDVPVEIRPRYQYFTEANITRLMSIGLSSPQWSLEMAVADYVKNYLAKSGTGNEYFSCRQLESYDEQSSNTQLQN